MFTDIHKQDSFGSFNEVDRRYNNDLELPKLSVYDERVYKSKMNVPIFSIDQHINDKLKQYAPMLRKNTQLESVKRELISSGVDFKVEHKDQMMKFIEQFQDNEKAFSQPKPLNTMVVGLNHQTALVEVREKFSMTDEVMERISKDLRKSPLVKEVAILNTCNRLEIYIVSHKIDETVDVIC